MATLNQKIRDIISAYKISDRQFAIKIGVIDYILGHKLGGGGSTLYYYISVTPAQATAAIRLVLDNLK